MRCVSTPVQYCVKFKTNNLCAFVVTKGIGYKAHWKIKSQPTGFPVGYCKAMLLLLHQRHLGPAGFNNHRITRLNTETIQTLKYGTGTRSADGDSHHSYQRQAVCRHGHAVVNILVLCFSITPGVPTPIML